MNYIGTLVKTIQWEHAEQIVENTMCNRTEIRLSLWYYTQGSAQIGRKAMLVDVRRWS